MMSAIRHIPFVLALSLVVRVTPIGLVAHASAVQPSSAPSGHLHDRCTHSPAQDQHGPRVILRVRALVPEKVKLNDPTQGTVRVTVLAIDAEIKQVTVQTDEGQRLLLFLPPESLARLQVGVPCLLQVTNGLTREASRPPEPEEAFW
jgi:hypothetical protein